MYFLLNSRGKERTYKVIYYSISKEHENIHENQIEHVECYYCKKTARIIHIFICILSCGLFPLILSWFPIYYFKLLHSRCSLSECEKVLIRTKVGKKYVEKIINIQLYHHIKVVMNDYKQECLEKSKRNRKRTQKNEKLMSVMSEHLGEEYKELEIDIQDENEELYIEKFHSEGEDIHRLGNRRKSSSFEKVNSTVSIEMDHLQIQSKTKEPHYYSYMFEFLGLRYVYIVSLECFVELQFYISYPFEYIHQMSKGIKDQELILDRELLYGECNLNIPMEPFFELLFKEIIHPFFIFQICAIILWCLDSYYEYACTIFFITIISTFIEIYSTYENQNNLKKMAYYECVVNVHRFHKTIPIDSRHLVPGDIYEIENDMKIPCDTLLLTGSATMLEYMLTGESVPVNKSSLPYIEEAEQVSSLFASNLQGTISVGPSGQRVEGVEFIERNKEINRLDDKGKKEGTRWNEQETRSNAGIIDMREFIDGPRNTSSQGSFRLEPLRTEEKFSKHTLYAGTIVLSTHGSHTQHKKTANLGLVIRTGFVTTKGRLINSILHSDEARLNLIQDSYKFLAILGLYAMMSALITLLLTILHKQFSKHTIIRCLDLITDAVPPALPTTLTVGIAIAIKRLKQKYSVSCIAPERINLAGQVNTMVFDKTGTLTESRLDFLGVVPNSEAGLVDFISVKDSDCTKTENAQGFIEQELNGKNEKRQPHWYDIFSFFAKWNNVCSRIRNCLLFRFSRYGEVSNQKNVEGTHDKESMCEYYDMDTLSIEPHISESNSKNESEEKFNEHSFSVIMRKNHSIFLDALACCHSLTKIENELVGDILEVLMFQSTNCHLEIGKKYIAVQKEVHNLKEENSPFKKSIFAYGRDNEKTVQTIYHIVKQFEFNSSLQRMSVIVYFLETKEYFLFCKGSPEKIKELCSTSVDGQVPLNYDQVLHSYANMGMRIISVCYRKLSGPSGQIFNASRNSIERNLTFLGFLIFANPLKKSACSVIKKLQSSGCRCIMSTGDNIMTSISVAKQCGIIDENIQSIIIGDVINVNRNEKLVWCVDKNDALVMEEQIGGFIESNDSRSRYVREQSVDDNYTKLFFDDLCKILIHKDPRTISIVLSGEAFRVLKNEFESLHLPFYEDCEEITREVIKRKPQKSSSPQGIYYDSKMSVDFIRSLYKKSICYNKLFYKIQNRLYKHVLLRSSHKRKLPSSSRNNDFINIEMNQKKNQGMVWNNSIHKEYLSDEKLDGAREHTNEYEREVRRKKESSLERKKLVTRKNDVTKRGRQKISNTSSNVSKKLHSKKHKGTLFDLKKFIHITEKRKTMDLLLCKEDHNGAEIMSDELHVFSLNKMNLMKKKKKKINRYRSITESILKFPEPFLSFCVIEEPYSYYTRHHRIPSKGVFPTFMNYLKRKKNVGRYKNRLPEEGGNQQIVKWLYMNSMESSSESESESESDSESEGTGAYSNSDSNISKKKRKRIFSSIVAINKSVLPKNIIISRKEKIKKRNAKLKNLVIAPMNSGIYNKEKNDTEKYPIKKEPNVHDTTSKDNKEIIGNDFEKKELLTHKNTDSNIQVRKECVFHEVNENKNTRSDPKPTIIEHINNLKQSLFHKCRNDTCSQYAHIKNIKLPIYEYILRTCTVYARMNPDYKTQLILSLKNLPNNPFIGMCGDGSNDCGALRCADIGVSLSNNESSICAPFTSDNFYLHSVINILVEGRAALVNSFQLFKFISLYSIIQCSVVLVLYMFSNNLTDNQFIYTDIFTILPLSIFMSWTSASSKLSSEIPLGKLFCFPVLCSLYGQIFIQVFFIALSLLILFQQPFYEESTEAFPLGDASNKKLVCAKNTVAFIVSSFQILFICIVLNLKNKWRKSIMTNFAYVLWLFVLLSINTIITIFSSETLFIGSFVKMGKKYLGLVNFPIYFRFYLCVILFLNFMCTFLFEMYYIRYLEKKEVQKNSKHNHISVYPVPTEQNTKVFVTCL